jgi:predicted 3-demethylubiquinone-9 3-methyltransferase (glyoxalase superfamily)
MLQDKDAEKAKRAMDAMLKMTKLDIKTLKEAYDSAMVHE